MLGVVQLVRVYILGLCGVESVIEVHACRRVKLECRLHT